ncbi:PAS domain-containing protein [Rhodococcus sp. PAM 2766]|uniref:PAS domain-containing protein n=1 Tax=Rhodococcus parequi TaxID=3137122 RepID=A0ABW9F9B3_9NOCA
MSDAVESPVASAEPAAPPLSPAVGSFRFFSKSQLWQWSAEVAHMHGYPDAMEVTTELVLGHKHPDDIERIATTIQTLIASGRAFCSRHRIIDIHGHEHPVMVISHKMLDKDGTGLRSEGFYIDLTGTRDIDVEEVIDSRVADAAASRAAIEQVKGMFMPCLRHRCRDRLPPTHLAVPGHQHQTSNACRNDPPTGPARPGTA